MHGVTMKIAPCKYNVTFRRAGLTVVALGKAKILCLYIIAVNNEININILPRKHSNAKKNFYYSSCCTLL